MTDSTKENERALTQRLDELGVSIEPDALEELAEAYAALVEWMRIAEELAER